MSHKIDRERLQRAAESIGWYPGSLVWGDLMKVVEAYEAEADPPDRPDEQR